MCSFVILLHVCIAVVVGLVSADHESKAIGKTSKSNEDLAINSPNHVAFLDSETNSSNTDQILPDQTLSLRELPEQNILDQNLSEKNLPHQNLPFQNLPDQNLPAAQSLSDSKNLPHQNPPYHSLPDEQTPEDAPAVSDRALSNDVESQETGKGLGSFSPISNNSIRNATSDCSTAPNHRTTFRTIQKHFQMLGKLAHRNTDSKFLDVARSAAKKTRRRIQGKLKISNNNNDDSRTELYKRLPHKLRLAIAKTNSHEHAFLEEAAHSRDRATSDRIWGLLTEKRLDEKLVLRTLVEEAGSKGGALVVGYKALRNGKSWERGNPRFVNFFLTASPLLSEYETWKKGELEIDFHLTEAEVEKPPTESAEKTRHGSTTQAKETEANGNHESHKSGVEEARRDRRRMVRSADDSVAMTESHSVLQSLLNRLPDVLKDKMIATDNVETQILDLCAESKNVTHKEIGVYNSAKKTERELLKRVLKEADTYGPRILEIYKLIRRGDAWDYVKLNNTYEPFFENPSPELNVYEGLKKDELTSLDAFLKDEKHPARKKDDDENDEAGIDDVHRMVRAEEDAESGRNETEKQNRENMGRKLKAEGTTEEMVSVGASGDVNETSTQEVNGTDDVLTSRDDVTSADVACTKKTEADRRESERRNFIGLAIILSIFINAILAIVIVALYKKEILVWYRRRQLEKGILPKGETAPLNQVTRILRTANTYM